MIDRRFEVVTVVRVNDGICKPFFGNLTNYDVYNGKFKHDACIEPFEIPHDIIEHIFVLVATRFKHDCDGVYTADIHIFDDNVQVGGCKVQIFVEDNRIMGVNKDYCYPRRKGKGAADE